MARGERRARSMGDARPWAARLPACAGPRATPRAEVQRRLHRPSSGVAFGCSRSRAHAREDSTRGCPVALDSAETPRVAAVASGGQLVGACGLASELSKRGLRVQEHVGHATLDPCHATCDFHTVLRADEVVAAGQEWGRPSPHGAPPHLEAALVENGQVDGTGGPPSSGRRPRAARERSRGEDRSTLPDHVNGHRSHDTDASSRAGRLRSS